jgi:hypothetical protein
VYRVCSNYVTIRHPGVFIEVRLVSETMENGAGAAVYAAPMNTGGIGRTIGPGVRILSPPVPLPFDTESLHIGSIG